MTQSRPQQLPKLLRLRARYNREPPREPAPRRALAQTRSISPRLPAMWQHRFPRWPASRPRVSATWRPSMPKASTRWMPHNSACADQEGPVESARERGGEVVRAGAQHVIGSSVGDRREDRQSQGASHLLRGVDQSRGQTGLMGSDAADGGDGHGDEGEAEAECREQGGPEHVAREGAAGPAPREPQPPTGDQEQAAEQDRLEAEAGHGHGGTCGRGDDPDRQRQVAEPCLQGRVVEYLLHVQRHEEEHREQRHPDQQSDRVGAAQRPLAEDREGHQRCALAGLDRQEHDEQDHCAGDLPERGGRAPANVDGVDQRVDEQGEAGSDRHRAGKVEAPRLRLGVAFAEDPGGQEGAGETDGHVDEQHPAPAEPAGEDAAEEDAGCSSGAGHGPPDAERAVALFAVGERGPDGHSDAGDGRPGGSAQDPAGRGALRPASPRSGSDGAGDGRRSRVDPGGGDGRVPGKADPSGGTHSRSEPYLQPNRVMWFRPGSVLILVYRRSAFAQEQAPESAALTPAPPYPSPETPGCAGAPTAPAHPPARSISLRLRTETPPGPPPCTSGPDRASPPPTSVSTAASTAASGPPGGPT